MKATNVCWGLGKAKLTLHNTSHLLAGKRDFESTPSIILSIGLKPDEYVLKPIATGSPWRAL